MPSASASMRSRSARGLTLRTIVGVVNDVHDDRLDQPSRVRSSMSRSSKLRPRSGHTWDARSCSLSERRIQRVDATTLVKPLRRVVAQLDNSLPIADSHTMMSSREGLIGDGADEHAAPVVAWRNRARPRHGWRLWRRVVLREPANAGDRHPIGARRDAVVDLAVRHAPRSDADRCRG